jgi:hypothetical protein
MDKVKNLDNQIFNIIEEIQDIIDAIQCNLEKEHHYAKVFINCQN